MTLLAAALISAGCIPKIHVAVQNGTPVRLAEDVKAKIAVNMNPQGQPEDWQVIPDRRLLLKGQYVIERKK